MTTLEEMDEVVLFINRFICEKDFDNQIILLPKIMFNEVAINFLPQEDRIPEKWFTRCLESNWPAIQIGGFTYIQSNTLPERNCWFYLSNVGKEIDLFLLKDYLTSTRGVPIDLIVEYSRTFSGNKLTESEYRLKKEQAENIKFKIGLHLKL